MLDIGIKCPHCKGTSSKVVDTRPTKRSTEIRRRRECYLCKKRFTTYEIVKEV